MCQPTPGSFRQNWYCTAAVPADDEAVHVTGDPAAAGNIALAVTVGRDTAVTDTDTGSVISRWGLVEETVIDPVYTPGASAAAVISVSPAVVSTAVAVDGDVESQFTVDTACQVMPSELALPIVSVAGALGAPLVM
jgi:hypothetical protein